MDERINLDGKKKTNFIRDIHKKEKQNIEKRTKHYATKLIRGVRKLSVNQEIEFDCI